MNERSQQSLFVAPLTSPFSVSLLALSLLTVLLLVSAPGEARAQDAASAQPALTPEQAICF